MMDSDEVVTAIGPTDAELIKNTCTSVNLRRAARAASHILNQELQRTGLRPGQFGILVQVYKVGSMTITHLADEMVIDRTTISRNVALMQRDGLLTLNAGKDRRIREITLTEAGKRKLAEAYPLWRKAEEGIRERLGADRWEQTLSNARAVAELVDSYDDVE